MPRQGARNEWRLATHGGTRRAPAHLPRCRAALAGRAGLGCDGRGADEAQHAGPAAREGETWL